MLYYRKFGFEIGCFGKQCNYLLSMIPSFDLKDGYFVLVDESNRKQVLSDVKQLYGAWEVKYNGMIHNEGYEYAFVTESNPYKDQEFTYTKTFLSDFKTSLSKFSFVKCNTAI